MVVDIGISGDGGKSNFATATLPGLGYTVDPTPRNPQLAGWTDVFAVTVRGDQLTVRRMDSAKGWGQPLQLLATPPDATRSSVQSMVHLLPQGWISKKMLSKKKWIEGKGRWATRGDSAAVLDMARTHDVWTDAIK